MISSLLHRHLVGLRPRVYYTLTNFRGGGEQGPLAPPSIRQRTVDEVQGNAPMRDFLIMVQFHAIYVDDIHDIENNFEIIICLPKRLHKTIIILFLLSLEKMLDLLNILHFNGQFRDINVFSML